MMTKGKIVRQGDQSIADILFGYTDNTGFRQENIPNFAQTNK